MSAVVRAYAQGRMLFIETTDLDKGEPVIWDMGAIATRGVAAACRRFTFALRFCPAQTKKETDPQVRFLLHSAPQRRAAQPWTSRQCSR